MRCSMIRAACLGSVALALAAPVGADPVLQESSCALGSSTSTCDQIDPKSGKLVAIRLSYGMSVEFRLLVVGDKYGTTDFKASTSHHLDLITLQGGGTLDAFKTTTSGTVTVRPKDSLANDGGEKVVVQASRQTEVTAPEKLARFVGTGSVGVTPIAEPDFAAGLPVVGAGTVQQFSAGPKTVYGTLTLVYQPVPKAPVVKLPKQFPKRKLPRPWVRPSPSAKPTR